MVSDSELVQRLRELLQTADLSTTTNATVRRQLESEFNVSLADKKAFIRQQIDVILRELHNSDEKEEEEGKEEEEEVKEEEEEEEEEGREEEGEEAEGSGSGSVEEEEEEEEEVEDSNGGSSKKRRSSKLKEKVKKRGGGFTKLCTLSPELHEFIGESELARTEVVKRLWAYIRGNSLQDPSNKRRILCDERLQSLFNVKSIDMFQMNKALSRHIWPLNSEEAPPVKSPLKEKQQKKDKDAEDESHQKQKRQKGGSSGFLAPLQLSDALVKFIGTGENQLPRSDVIKRMWEYIKQNNLQDPADKRNVICDEKLKELFQIDSFIGFTVTKLLAAHFIKIKQ